MTAPVSPATTTGATHSSVLDPYSVENAKNARLPSQTTGVSKDSFLTLLVTQLRNQDPLQPVGNTEFITQLAQFQSLESQLDANAKIQDLVSLQQSQLALSGLSQAALLVGKDVTWIDAEGKEGSGTVKSVTVENGVMMINTANAKVPVGALTSIALGTIPQAGGGSGQGSGGEGDGNGSQTPPASGQPALSNSLPSGAGNGGPDGHMHNDS